MTDVKYCYCLVICFLIVCGYNIEDTLAQKDSTRLHPASDFSRHTVVKPKIYHGREKRQISSTREENGEHSSHLEIKLKDVDGKEFILDLTLNKQLIPKGFFQKHQENGGYKIETPTAQKLDLCHYNGKVRNALNSWAAISTCDGLSGVFYDGEEMHYVEKDAKENSSNLDTKHFLYKHSDLRESNKTCGYGGDSHTHGTAHGYSDEHNRILRYKRSTGNNEMVRGPYKANKESKYVELVLVVDNKEFKELGESRSKVVNHCKSIANIINGLYSPLNIFIALVGVVIWSEHDEIIFSKNGDATLTSFLHYRREKLIKEHHNDNAQLLTQFQFENGVVGKALKGPICTYEYSGGVNTDHSPVVGLVATTVAHEMGHNFGMEHDTNECKCPEDRCIMAPSSSTVAPTHWSSCSLNYLLLAFSHGMDYCLKNKPVSLFDSPVCGNGFVEPGEQCDCGLPEHCDNTCCNATTCMLHSNASCATGECCDLTTCRPKNAGTLCRSADYECDLPEFCTGQSEYCPADIYKLDTEICDGGKAFCYHGYCRTRTDQCKLLWGETGKSSDDQCYEMNKKGTRHGNCGYNKLNQSYFKCENESVLCGMLHCKHLNERLEFGMESVAILSHSFINKKGSIIPCRTAIVDLGINQIDPGLTPDGAKCGEGKMCVNQKCMSVSSLRQQGPYCPQDCNGNGWCNSLGHCHCKDGFAPPFCEYPGPGGSDDSGPASDPNARQGVVVAIYVIFLGIVPLVALVAFLMYYARQINFIGKKPSATTSKSPSKSRSSSFPPQTAKKGEDNHSLLHKDNPPSSGIHNEFFGNFKGFSLTPMKKNTPEPVRVAPPPPKPSPPGWSVPANQEAATTNPQQPPVSSNAATIKSLKNSFLNKPVQKINSFRNTTASGIWNTNNTAAVPALPPPNPGSHARPIISSPVLESSTSNAKELVSPLRHAPKVPFRPAPEAPATKQTRPLSTPDAVTHTTLDVSIKPDAKKVDVKDNKDSVGGGALNRIASFLKSADKKPVINSNSAPPPNQVKANKILDKNTLRNLEISKPIPQTEIDIAITVLPVEEAKKNVVMRAQSMRAPKQTQRPHIQTFGSMRQPPGLRRPLSIPSGSRPKSPPPPLPLVHKSTNKLPGLPGYQEPLVKKSGQDQYDDCLNQAAPLARLSEENSPTSGDNIYAVIEETPIVSPISPRTNTSNSASNDSMGLLGEIVSEIQNRNFDSIYSTSTLNRKKKEAKEKMEKNSALQLTSPDSSETYVNTASPVYKSPGSEYSNMSNITSSTSTSGYIQPSAVNVRVKPPDKKVKGKDSSLNKDKPVLSSFSADSSTKPFSSTFSRPPGPLALGISLNSSTKKSTESNNDGKTITAKSKTTPPSPTNKTTSKSGGSFNRQVTPPNLRTRKSSPSRTTPPNQKFSRSSNNSPDLVTSCNSNTSNKGPDVLNNGVSVGVRKPAVASVKPTLNNVPKVLLNKGNAKSVSFKSPQDKKNDVKPPIAAKVTKANSDVGANKTASIGVKNTARQNSNVASLQQKFEGQKNNIKTASDVKV